MTETFSRVPPHNLEAEQSLLGAMMLSEEATAAALEIVDASDFFQAAHRFIFQALIDLFQSQKPCDPVTLQEELRSKGRLQDAGGASYLSQLLNAVVSTANAAYHAKIIKEKALLRRLIQVSGEIGRDAADPQAAAEIQLDLAEQKILSLSQFRMTRPYVRIKELVGETFTALERLYEHKQAITGVPSGFTKLDEYTAGFQPSDLIIVAARPSMGKTAFCLNIAQYAAHQCQMPTLIFSLEMAKSQLATRLMCAEARIDGQKVRRGFLGDEDWAKITRTAGVLENTPLFIDDTPGASLLEIRSKARRAASQEKIKLIVIDYLQLITLPGSSSQDNRQQEVSAISRGLKGLARELNVPVICLSQLSRAVESRTDKRPMLSDLRESGAIEQDADVVLFLYRDSYYNPKKEEARNKAEVIIAKQRNGPVGSIELAFFAEFAKFENLETVHTEY
ncbi:MAG: Replicative DNA helicase [Candidatus Ozemobacter sibiricus]|jgi:replicative DNA helicase|uniref:Replicative DNA helicase n=1 Tax=Candidatus Ozemobacter sibiricus TaxID=2268124 RepID=A0A367ZMS8_9BACT|nr:MAG: Replicative DNA helicase [Candidatus Ozemobacter sibiricus]